MLLLSTCRPDVVPCLFLKPLLHASITGGLKWSTPRAGRADLGHRQIWWSSFCWPGRCSHKSPSSLPKRCVPGPGSNGVPHQFACCAEAPQVGQVRSSCHSEHCPCLDEAGRARSTPALEPPKARDGGIQTACGTPSTRPTPSVEEPMVSGAFKKRSRSCRAPPSTIAWPVEAGLSGELTLESTSLVHVT
jgi:hypothetical protein